MSTFDFSIIVGGSFLASFINAAFGIGGAHLMLAIITSILPITAVIPMHSPLLLGSLIGRIIFFWREIYWPIVIPFVGGCLIGVFFGARVYIDLPPWFIALILGCLMLSVWLPGFRWGGKIPKPFFWVGIAHSFMSTVFAYGGLFHPIILRTQLNKLQLTATIAGSLLTMSLLKIVGYISVGFDYRPYVIVIISAIAISFLGTWMGRHVTNLIPEQHFRLIFKLAMTFFGLRLLYRAWVLS
jgi:uncharacterized membrane protein YfcA